MTLAEPAGRPLLVTADELLLDELLRLAAAAGVTPEVAADAVSARRCWATASLVLVGVDLLDPVARSSPVRRAGVSVVSREPDDASVWQRALSIAAESVLLLPAEEGALRDRLADTVDGGGCEAVTVSVVGGNGGAGASTFASALAVVAARRGLRVLLVDGDPLGGGVDLVVGAEDAQGLRWPDLMGTQGRVSAPSLRAALPALGLLSVVSWDRGDPLVMPPETMRAVVSAGQRGNDLVVIDLPRRLDGAGEEALLHSVATLLVVSAEVRAVAAAGRVRDQLITLAAGMQVVVRGPGPTGLDGRLVADTLGLPLAVELRSERGLAEAVDRGFGPCRKMRGALVGACAALLDGFGLSGRAAA
jgi:secretion/DNA translocation related CpaE-like protein